MNRIKLVALTAALFFAAQAFAAGEHCSATYLADRTVPGTSTTQKVAVLTDPSGAQVAQFDLTWGAILVSLKYNGTEYVAAPNTISGNQTILRRTNYTPTMGGDSANNGSIVTGAACSSLKHLWLTSNMTDYNANALASTGYVYTRNNWRFSQLTAPYIVSTHAFWVPNPSGSPAYYLRINRTISNIDGVDIDGPENYSFTLDSVLAVPTSYSVYSQTAACTSTGPCANSTPSAAIGYYTSSTKLTGIALATFPATFWNGQPGGVYFSTESFADRRVLHINRTSFSVAPQTSHTYSLLLMPGSWTTATGYLANLCGFSAAPPSSNTFPASGDTRTIGVTANAGCSWDARTDVSWISLSTSTGTGNGTLSFTVAPNTTNFVRMGNIYVAGRILTFWQSAPASGLRRELTSE